VVSVLVGVWLRTS